MITVCSVMRALGMDAGSDLGKRVAWSAGARVRDLWKASHDGERPLVRLTPKTNGAGTHDKATYPEHWRARIEAAIHDAELDVGAVPDPRQTGLFG